ncbi:MAG: FG-GAP repeat domain-containing protein [Phycisphaerales bacterium]
MRAVIGAELDGDSVPEIAWVETNGMFIVLERDESGVYWRRYQRFFEGRDPIEMFAIDFDRDSDLDPAWLDEERSAMEVLWNPRYGDRSNDFFSIGVSANPARAMSVADFNGDRLLDLVASDATAVIGSFGDGRGGFGPRTPLFTIEPTVMDVVGGDFDDDGDQDLAALHVDYRLNYYYEIKVSRTQVSIYLNDGDASFTLTASVDLPYDDERHRLAESLRAGDLDGDGDLDFVVGIDNREDRAHDFRFVENTGNGSVMLRDELIQVSVLTHSMFDLVDADLDGDLDILAPIGASLWSIEGLDGFEFAEPREGPALTDIAWNLAVSDLDMDGRPDLVVASNEGVSVHLNETAVDGPSLSLSELQAGEVATLTVTGAAPDEEVQFFYSRDGRGHTPGLDEFGGMVLDLNGIVYPLGSAVADGDGTAVFTSMIPDEAPPALVIMQAAIRRGTLGESSVKTPALEVRVER